MKLRPTWRGTLLFIVSALPTLALMPLGLLWLWQHDGLLWWLLVAISISALSWVLRRGIAAGDTVDKPSIQPDRYWPDHGQAVWHSVEQYAAKLKLEDYPLDARLSHRLLDLGLDTIRLVARHYHPHAAEPELEVPLPQVLLTAERVCRDLRALTDYVPLSHRITLAQWQKAPGLMKLTQAYDLWRMARLVINPAAALVSEARAQVQGRLLNESRDELALWLLKEFVKGTGRHAIDLYSRQLLLDDPAPLDQTAPPVAAPHTAKEQPFRILVVGQIGSGKSSVINALLSETAAMTDLLAKTQTFAHYPLEHPELPAAVLLDSPGYSAQLAADTLDTLDKELLKADLVLLVCAAYQAGRAADTALLAHLRGLYQGQPQRNPPGLIGVLTFIDRLPPPREWSPPYPLEAPATTKAQNISAAVRIIAAELQLDSTRLVPVRSDADHVYNIIEGLLPLIRNSLATEGERARYLRWLDQQQQSAQWRKALQQTGQMGRLLGRLGQNLGGRWVRRGRRWLSGTDRS